MKRKKVLKIFLSLFALYLVWLAFHLLRFRTYQTDFTDPLEIEGVYHIHTTYSDGRGRPDDVVAKASAAGLDFIILTDHGNPNYDSVAFQGWKEGVLVLAGSELSVNRGHLVALNFTPPETPFSQQAEEASYQVVAAGGLTIIAHPYSKTSWTWGPEFPLSGIELITADAMLRRNFFWMLPYFPLLALKSEIPTLKMLTRPEKNFNKWDELSQKHPVYAYYSTDAHILYGPLFSLLRLHLLLDSPLSGDFEEDRQLAGKALAQGRFYNTIEAAARASGFRFWGERGKKFISMGSKIKAGAPVTLHIKTPFSFKIESHLLHNGKILLRSAEQKTSYKVTRPGTYRAEVFLKERTPLSDKVPWILSNPLWLMEE